MIGLQTAFQEIRRGRFSIIDIGQKGTEAVEYLKILMEKKWTESEKKTVRKLCCS